jgi:hypothetical protein
MKAISWWMSAGLMLGVGVASAQVAKSTDAAVMVAAAGDSAAMTDPMLKAMKEELTREQAELVLPGMQRPYFMGRGGELWGVDDGE